MEYNYCTTVGQTLFDSKSNNIMFVLFLHTTFHCIFTHNINFWEVKKSVRRIKNEIKDRRQYKDCLRTEARSIENVDL